MKEAAKLIVELNRFIFLGQAPYLIIAKYF